MKVTVKFTDKNAQQLNKEGCIGGTSDRILPRAGTQAVPEVDLALIRIIALAFG